MKQFVGRFALLTGIVLAGSKPMLAQVSSPIERTNRAFDVIATYNAMHSQTLGGGGFFMQGGGIELYKRVITAWNVGAVADATESRAGSSASSPGIDLLTITLGPRITTSRRDGQLDFYMQGLAGKAIGSHSIFPCASGICTHASGIAIDLGYGVDFRVREGLMLRLVQGEYLHTRLPNGASNAENNLRVSTGLVIQFH